MDNIIRHFQSFLLLEKGLNNNTYLSYNSDITQLLSFIEDKKIRIENISYADILAFLSILSKNKISTQARYIVSINLFLNFLYQERYIKDKIPVISTPKKEQYVASFLTIAEVELLINYVSSDELSIRNHCMINIMYNCGLRVSELLNIKYEDFCFKNNTLKVFGKNNKERIVPFSMKARKIILNYLNNFYPKLNVFYSKYICLSNRGKVLTRARLWQIIQDIILNLKIDVKVSPHTLRHCFASHLLSYGADIMSIKNLLGHESVTTTQMYTHIDKQHLKNNHNKFHPRS